MRSSIGSVDVGVRRPRDVERLDIIIGQRHFDAAVDRWRCRCAPAALLVVLYLTMFVNNSSSVKSTVGSKPRVDLLAGERLRSESDDALDRVEAALERADAAVAAPDRASPGPP